MLDCYIWLVALLSVLCLIFPPKTFLQPNSLFLHIVFTPKTYFISYIWHELNISAYQTSYYLNHQTYLWKCLVSVPQLSLLYTYLAKNTAVQLFSYNPLTKAQYSSMLSRSVNLEETLIILTLLQQQMPTVI